MVGMGRKWETSGVRAQHTISQVQESLVQFSESINLYMIAYIQGVGVIPIKSHLSSSEIITEYSTSVWHEALTLNML